MIENHQSLREKLASQGHRFRSDTDTEVLAHLVGLYYQQADDQDDNAERLTTAVRQALKDVVGTYGIAVVHDAQPNTIVGARRGSPLLVGVGRREHFLASGVA